MIVDCHTQVWDSRAQLGRSMAVIEETVPSSAMRLVEAVETVDRAIVLGFKSRYLEAEIPNQFVSEYVRRYSSKLIGFAGIDPTEPTCLDDLAHCQEDLGLKGVTISPALQNFHPSDTQAMRLYEACANRSMPLVIEQNHRNPAAKLEFARPTLFDEVAREFPDLRLVIAHMGYPWLDETIVMLSKHKNVYADVAALLRRPWLSYNALLKAYEYGVIDKLLFGSDYPYRSPAACIEALYSINQVSYGTNLVTIPRELLRGIVEREALALLGIQEPTPIRVQATTKIVDDEV